MIAVEDVADRILPAVGGRGATEPLGAALSRFAAALGDGGPDGRTRAALRGASATMAMPAANQSTGQRSPIPSAVILHSAFMAWMFPVYEPGCMMARRRSLNARRQ